MEGQKEQHQKLIVHWELREGIHLCLCASETPGITQRPTGQYSAVQQQLQHGSYRQTWTSNFWFGVWEEILASCSCWKVQCLGMVIRLMDPLASDPRKLEGSHLQPLDPEGSQKVLSLSLTCNSLSTLQHLYH